MTENSRDQNIRCVYHDPQSPRWEWIHILTFPVDLLNKTHETPYATGVVVGMQGVVSTNRTRWTMPYLPPPRISAITRVMVRGIESTLSWIELASYGLGVNLNEPHVGWNETDGSVLLPHH